MSTANPTKMNSESRKLRNRLSQKAFRARQAMRIKELEERLEQEPISDAARTVQLQDRNAILRNQLLDCHKKISSLQISLKILADSTALALGLDTAENTQPTGLCTRCRGSEDGEDQHTSPDEGYSSHTSRPDLEQLEEESCNQADNDFHATQMPDTDCTMDETINPMHQSLPTQESQVETVAGLQNRQVFLGHDQGRLHQPAMNMERLDFCPPSDHFGPLSSSQRRPSIENSGNDNGVFTLMPQCPPLFPFKGMGFEHYGDLLDRSRSINPCSQLPLRRTNSTFSDHVSAVEYFLQQRWLKQSPRTFDDDQFMESIKFMISAFVSVSWQPMTAWHTYTKAHIPLKDLTAWRITQTPEAYAKIIPSYRPSKLQMTTQHPAIIDWIPWSSLRDKVIIYHSANPCLDNIICDIGNSYVVHADISALVAGFPEMIGYVSVWDLVRAIAPDATRPDSGSSTTNSSLDNDNISGGNHYFTASNGACAYDADAIRDIIDDVDDDDDDDETSSSSNKITLPAPDTSTLFSSKALAIQAFKALGMDKGAATFCLDPEFFGRHPELYDPQCDIMARGVPLRPSSHLSVPIPRELNSTVVGQYRELTRWAFDRNPGE